MLRVPLALCSGNAGETRCDVLQSVAVLFGASRHLAELHAICFAYALLGKRRRDVLRCFTKCRGASRSIVISRGALNQTLYVPFALCSGNAGEMCCNASQSVAVLHKVSRHLAELQNQTLRVSLALCPGNAGETRWINKKEGFGFENHPTRSYLSRTQARSRSYQSVNIVAPRDATGYPQLASVLRSYA
jgi:hypothetical protein